MMPIPLLLAAFLPLVASQGAGGSFETVCPPDWVKSDRYCYHLANGTAQTREEAKLRCHELLPGSYLPVVETEARWMKLELDLKADPVFANKDTAYWLDLRNGTLPRARKGGWLWLDLIPAEFLPWQAPPANFLTDLANAENPQCAAGWFTIAGAKGWTKVPCNFTTNQGIPILCERKSYVSIPNFNQANSNITVKGVADAFKNMKLPNGTPISFAVTEDMLKKANELINTLGRAVAAQFNLTDRFKPVESPLKGDNLVLPDDLLAEAKIVESILPAITTVATTVAATTVAATTTAPAQTTTGLEAPPIYGRKKRGTPVKDNSWGTKRNITYNYDADFIAKAPENKALFDQAIKFWQENTCFDFELSNSADLDLIVIYGGGCYSTVGKAKHKPPQALSLGDGCGTFAIASHELAHTLGLAHEQARTDRENYVDVFLPNINPSFLDNFRPCCDCLEPNPYSYDYGSVMHYGPKDFTANGGPTILPKDPKFYHVIGSADRPTFLDVKAVNDMNCKDSCNGQQAAKCQNGGYPHPKNCSICLCPFGFSGATCSEFANAGCGHERMISENYHEFASPNYPDAVENASCAWHFKSLDPTKVLEIEISDTLFDLPEECYYGYVEIIDGVDVTITGVRFCGTIQPSRIQTKGDSAVVAYKVIAHGGLYRGFAATVRAVTPTAANHTIARFSDAHPPSAQPNATFLTEFELKSFRSERAATLTCATVAGSVQNAGPAGLTLD